MELRSLGSLRRVAPRANNSCCSGAGVAGVAATASGADTAAGAVADLASSFLVAADIGWEPLGLSREMETDFRTSFHDSLYGCRMSSMVDASGMLMVLLIAQERNG